ncbi:MAG: alkaline phosphatase family protein [Pseudomonadota bacterium]
MIRATSKQSLHHAITLATVLAMSATPALAADNVILITLDGLRWQEVFRGIDKTLATHEEYSARSEQVMREFWHEDAQARAQALMPFLHNVMFREGSYVGNRDADSCAQVSNPWYFSYPGYSEILTGVVNPAIDTNGKNLNPEKTLLELLNATPAYRQRVGAFASWDVFPYIFNVERSGVPVNALGTAIKAKTPEEVMLAELAIDIPTPWETVRHDAFTHHYAKVFIAENQPRVTYISYGETDDFAHEGRYDDYAFAAQRADRFIGEIWELVQSLESYRDNTVLFVTVDHGRGEQPLETWQHHASKASLTGYMQSLAQYEEGIVGSESVWMAAIGPGVPANGLLQTGADCLTSNRIAATLMSLLGEDYRQYNPAMGVPMQEFLQ